MTEAYWLTCVDPGELLRSARRKKKLLTDRKFRLFAVACARSVRPLLASDNGRRAVEVAERYADGSATTHEMSVAQLDAIRDSAEAEDLGGASEYKANQALFAAINACDDRNRFAYAAECAVDAAPDPQLERAQQCALLRDILGNPFRPITFSPAWRSSTVLALAAQMYDSRDFGAMPILADALQEAGCDSADVLNHCRAPGVHVRGCWVVDLVLGKE
ncbi:hypothetical protein VT84_14425 [Gemmata sp. SH-PL17]|uniref:hypothetical protein n=1 Tax=Gemmata sp. SH-PL17 TaxID=1630693 RepID=UPI00078E4999|nr:hypothetical protein [Gemmata sp. SH-PL17]AMV25589.1 hypothetical protein VT84_14425 [Gemmata sp. SH-PL17]